MGEDTGTLAVWPVSAGAPREPRVFRLDRPEVQFAPAFDSSGSRILWGSGADRQASIWDIDGPPDAEPLVLSRPDAPSWKQGFFDQRGRWAVTVNQDSLAFWALGQAHARSLRRQRADRPRLTFSPDGRWLVSCSTNGARAWPLVAAAGASRRLDPAGEWCYGMAVAADGQHVLVAGPGGTYLAPFSGKAGQWLYRPEHEGMQGCAFDRTGDLAATAATFSQPPGRKSLRLWNLARGETRDWPLVPPGEVGDGADWGVSTLVFTPQGRLIAAGSGGVRSFDPATGASDWLWRLDRESSADVSLSGDGGHLAMVAKGKGGEDSRLFVVALSSGARQPIESHGRAPGTIALDATGQLQLTVAPEGEALEHREIHVPAGLGLHVGEVVVPVLTPGGAAKQAGLRK